VHIANKALTRAEVPVLEVGRVFVCLKHPSHPDCPGGVRAGAADKEVTDSRKSSYDGRQSDRKHGYWIKNGVVIGRAELLRWSRSWALGQSLKIPLCHEQVGGISLRPREVLEEAGFEDDLGDVKQRCQLGDPLISQRLPR